MTLGDDFRSSADMVREAAEADARQAYADWQEQRMLESDEAELAKWKRLFRRMAEERGEVHYDDRPGYDRRLFAIDGALDEPPVEQMQHWLGDAS